jgi:hypothetical protein
LSSTNTTLTFCLPQTPQLLFAFQIPHLLFVFHRYHTYFLSSTDTTLTLRLPQIPHLLFVFHRTQSKWYLWKTKIKCDIWGRQIVSVVSGRQKVWYLWKATLIDRLLNNPDLILKCYWCFLELLPISVAFHRYHTFCLPDTTLTICLPQISHLIFVFHRYHLLCVFHRYRTYFLSSTDTTLMFCFLQIPQGNTDW